VGKYPWYDFQSMLSLGETSLYTLLCGRCLFLSLQKYVLNPQEVFPERYPWGTWGFSRGVGRGIGLISG